MKMTISSGMPMLPNIGTSDLLYLLRSRPSHVNQATCCGDNRPSSALTARNN
jgi:hypothetical protein